MPAFDASRPAVRPSRAAVQSVRKRPEKPLTLEQQSDELTEAILDDENEILEDLDCPGLTHYMDHVTRMSLTDMIERCISNDPSKRTSAASTFDESKGSQFMQDQIKNAMLDNADDIVKWRQDPKGEWTKVFLSEPQDEAVGEGVRYLKGNLEHARAYQTIVVLSIDPRNKHGFRITTAFPAIKVDTAEVTGLDIKKELRQAPSYVDASYKRRMSLEQASDPPPETPARLPSGRPRPDSALAGLDQPEDFDPSQPLPGR